MSNSIVVRKVKFDGVEKRRFEGTVVEGAPEGWIAIVHTASRQMSWKAAETAFTSAYFVYLVNPAVPCVVSHYFNERLELLQIQADASMPPAVTAAEGGEFVDLDLDLIVSPDKSYYARDFDDFRANVVRLGYTPEAIKYAWDGLLWARQCAEARVFPFDDTAERILAANVVLKR